MNRFFYLAFSFLLFFLPGFPVANAQHDASNINCPLPPPQELSILGTTTTTLNLTWTPVAGAVLYKVSVYDQTEQNAHPDIFTTATSIVVGEMQTDAHNYLIGVSASACSGTDGFGNETTIEYKPGIIIIVDIIVQHGCPSLAAGNLAIIGLQVFDLPFNGNSGNDIITKRMRIASNSDPNKYVDFLIWVDCFARVRFCELAAQGAKKIPNGNTIRYVFSNSQALFFDIINGTCDINICNFSIKYYVPCQVSEGTCSIENNLASCGEKDLQSTQSRITESSFPPASISATVKPEPKNREQHTQSATRPSVAPNPFTDALHVEYKLEKPGLVSMMLFNATGALSQELFPLQWLESGAHSITFESQNTLPKGVYFLVLNAGNQRFVTPLLKQ